jgi:hypothetical protein
MKSTKPNVLRPGRSKRGARRGARGEGLVMRKIILSVLALTILSGVLSACSTSMIPFTNWQPRDHKYVQ